MRYETSTNVDDMQISVFTIAREALWFAQNDRMWSAVNDMFRPYTTECYLELIITNKSVHRANSVVAVWNALRCIYPIP